MTNLETFLQKNETAIRLTPEFEQLFKVLGSISPIKAELQSNSIRHAVTGEYGETRQRSHVLMHFYPFIDTRLFTAKWRYLFASQQNNLWVFNIFDRYGRAVYMVSSTSEEQNETLNELIEKLTESDNTAIEDIPAEKPFIGFNGEMDIEALRNDWRAMTDVHQASKILKYHANDHHKVFDALGEEFAFPISKQALQNFLADATQQALTIMMFARNESAVQCYAGTLPEGNYQENQWSFNNETWQFALQANQLKTIWLVLKPTDAGWIHSINCFDKNKREILIITDKRTRGESESEGWKNLVTSKLHQFDALK